MNHERSIFAGATDFTAVSTQDIVRHIIQWRKTTLDTIETLSKHRRKIEQLQDRIDYPADVLSYIDFFLRLFRRYAEELERLSGEITREITSSHVRAANDLASSARDNDDACKAFKRDHIQRPLKDESLRGLIDMVHGNVASQLSDYFDLSNVASRLEALVGSGGKSEQVLSLKPSWLGISIDLHAFGRRVWSMIKQTKR